MQVAVRFFEFLNGSLDTCGNEEILLFQTQFLTCIVIVIGIEHIADILCKVFLLNRFSVVTFVEQVKLEFADSLCVPDSQGVDDLVVVTYDRHIVWDSQHRLVTFLYEIVSACGRVIFYLYIASEFYFFGIFRTAKLEWITVFQPVIRHFHLESVLNLLFEQTIVVTDPAAISTVAESCQGIQETSRQSSQTAVSESRIRLLVFNHI